MQLRIIARNVVYDKEQNAILLVRNKGVSYWYPPGGGWEYEKENVLECAVREVKEETGLAVRIERFLYAQEFHDGPEKVLFEIFWLAVPEAGADLDAAHIDLDPGGQVEEARWFKKEDLQGLTVFPKRLQTTFWDLVGNVGESENPFIGISP